MENINSVSPPDFRLSKLSYYEMVQGNISLQPFIRKGVGEALYTQARASVIVLIFLKFNLNKRMTFTS